MSMDVTPRTPKLSDRVAAEIRAWLGRSRIPGAELARRLGVSGAWVSYRLTGTQTIDLDDLERIAAALGIEETDLLLPRESRPVVTAGAGRRRETPVNNT